MEDVAYNIGKDEGLAGVEGPGLWWSNKVATESYVRGRADGRKERTANWNQRYLKAGSEDAGQSTNSVTGYSDLKLST